MVSSYYRPYTPTERFLETIVVTVSILSSVLPLIRGYKIGKYEGMMAGFFSGTTSLFYHLGESSGRKILFLMNNGQWHRLDNIFIIFCVQLMWSYIFNIEMNVVLRYHDDKKIMNGDEYPYTLRKWIDRHNMNLFWKLVFFGMTVVCQEYAPWRVEYTFLPMVVAFVVCVIRYYNLPYFYRPQYNTTAILYGSLFLGVSLVFFVVGLDDKRDYLRIYHGIFHVLISVTAYFFYGVKSFKDPAKLVNQHDDVEKVSI